MENKEFELRMKELDAREAELTNMEKEIHETFQKNLDTTEKNIEILEMKEETLRKIKRANRTRARQIKFMIFLAVLIVIAAVFSTGMVLGRCLTFLSAFGC